MSKDVKPLTPEALIQKFKTWDEAVLHDECVQIAEALDEARADNAALEKEVRLLTHKVLTCGVAASHPDAALSRREKDYGGPWDSPQAEEVRALRDERDALLERLKKAEEAEVLPPRTVRVTVSSNVKAPRSLDLPEPVQLSTAFAWLRAEAERHSDSSLPVEARVKSSEPNGPTRDEVLERAVELLREAETMADNTPRFFDHYRPIWERIKQVLALLSRRGWKDAGGETL